MFDYKVIGSRLKAARKSKGLSQLNVAEILNVSVPYISKIETGRAVVSLKRLGELADILGADIGELVSGANYESKYYMFEELSSILADCSAEEKTFAYKMLREFKEMYKSK